MLLRQHTFHRLLRDQKSAEGTDRDRLLDFSRIEIDQRTARAIACVVNYNLRRAHAGIEVGPQKPGPGEVRVKLKTTGVNPSDVKSREGRTRKIAFPRVIPHSDGAGEIDMAGSGVPASRVGERVWVWNGQWKRPFGTCAEYVTLAHHQAVPLPTHVSFEIGACLGIPAMTAFHAITLAEAWAGATLLVSGGAGAVANYAIQF